MKIVGRSLAAILMALAFLSFVTPAQAADITIQGTKVSSVPTNVNSNAQLVSLDRPRCISRATGFARYSDDSVYVRDDCPDGNGAAIRIGWNINGRVTAYICANNSGAGTVVRCYIDWPEGGAVVKSYAAGLLSPSSYPGQPQWSNYTIIYD